MQEESDKPDDLAILVIAPSCRHGVTGIGLCIESMVNGFRERGHNIIFFDTSAPLTGNIVGRWALGKAFHQFLTLVRLVPAIYRTDIVYLTLASSKFGALRDAIIAAFCSALGKPAIGHLHGGGFRSMFDSAPRPLRKILRASIGSLDAAIVLTPRLRHQFKTMLPEDHIFVVSNGIEPPLTDEQVTKKLNTAPASPFRLLYLSNLIESKGYKEAIKATCIARKRCNGIAELKLAGARVEIVGNHDVMSQPEDSSFNKYDGVEFLGPVVGEQKQNLLLEADALIFPTYYAWEGQPLCIIEAIASGIPVISTKHKGIPEIVEDGKEAILLDGPDPEAFADAIETLANNHEVYKKMARSAQKRYAKDYSRRVYLDNLETVILRNSRPSPTAFTD